MHPWLRHRQRPPCAGLQQRLHRPPGGAPGTLWVHFRILSTALLLDQIKIAGAARGMERTVKPHASHVLPDFCRFLRQPQQHPEAGSTTNPEVTFAKLEASRPLEDGHACTVLWWRWDSPIHRIGPMHQSRRVISVPLRMPSQHHIYIVPTSPGPQPEV